jgi:hypothetical protein
MDRVGERRGEAALHVCLVGVLNPSPLLTVTELSHRGKEFKTIITEAERDLRALL